MFLDRIRVSIYQLAISYLVPLNINIFWKLGVFSFLLKKNNWKCI